VRCGYPLTKEMALKQIDHKQLDEALFNLGTICGQAGQLDAAADYLSRALRVSPNDADIHCNLANVYMARGNNPAAIFSLERALKNNPAHLQSRFNLAVLSLQQGDLSQAEKHLGAVLAVDPAYPKWELLDAAIKAARDRAGVR
jgi:tetratricopeptide (TPR) repeat protein